MDAVDQRARRVGHDRVDGHAGPGQHVLQGRAQRLHAPAGVGAERHRAGEDRTQQGDLLGRRQVGLVQGDQLWNVRGPLDRVDDGAHGLHLGDRVGVGGIHDVQDHVGLAHLLQGRSEGLDQLGGQVTHEADRVGERVLAPIRGACTAHRWVQRRKQRVLDEDARVRQAVEQRGLARVRVPGNRHRRHSPTATRTPLRAAGGLHARDVRAQLRHARADAATIQLDLGFTRAPRTDARTAGDAATGLTGHRFTPAAQARKQVLELSELHLRLALTGLGVLGENVEDEGRAVDDLGVHDVLEASALGGGQLLVNNDGVGLHRTHDLCQLTGLAGPQVGRGVGLHAALDDAVEHARTGGLRERGELTQRVLCLFFALHGAQAHEHDLFESHLAVFDLGDVLAVGSTRVDAARARAGLALQCACIPRVVLSRGRGERRCRAREDARNDVVDALVAFLDRGVGIGGGGVHIRPSRGGLPVSHAPPPSAPARAGAIGFLPWTNSTSPTLPPRAPTRLT